MNSMVLVLQVEVYGAPVYIHLTQMCFKQPNIWELCHVDLKK